MKINEVGVQRTSKVAFKSLRTDKQTIAQLAKGDKPIIENNRINIIAALNNMSSHSDAESISFLLQVADNLAYGQGNNSVFKDVIDEDHITPETRENTNWFQILDDTIRQALSKGEGEDVADLIDEYKRIFTDKKDLTPEQKELLDLRAELTAHIMQKTDIDDAESLSFATNIRQNLDYFVTSSETPIKQKKESLEKLVYFMSDEYKITPQLKDKKLQVLDEILNDIVVKTPEDKILKTKTTDQRQSGMCAAISICRKALAYEDKVRFISIITDELSDKPTITAFDVTELGSGKTVEIPKTKINYDIATEKGYRIIDASAHNWMHNAHASGNGTIQTENYVAFDDENYGIFDDSSWYTVNTGEHDEEKGLLRAIIKEKEYIESYSKMKKAIEAANRNYKEINKSVYDSQSKAMGILNSIFGEVFKNRTQAQNTSVIKSLFKFYTGTNETNEANVAPKLPKEIKQNLIADFIINSVQDITDEQKLQIKEKSAKILGMTEEYTQAEKRQKNLKRFSTPKNSYILNKRLFNIAAAHRVAVERDINLSDGITRFERSMGLPPREIQIAGYLKSLRAGLSSYKVRESFADKTGRVPTQKELETKLDSDLMKIETIIPKKMNDIAQTLYDRNLPSMLTIWYQNILDALKTGDKEILENAKTTMNLSGDKHKMQETLNNWVEKLSNEPTRNDVLEAVRMLGYDNSIHMHAAFLQSFIQSLQGGISEEQYKRLVKIFGGEDKIARGIEIQGNKFAKTKQEYDSILERWKVPTARDLILEKMEKQQKVLTRKQLNYLKGHLTSIEAGMARNEKIENTKDRAKANNKLFVFTDQEQESYASISKHISDMRKFANMEYQNLNDLLKYELEDLYAYIGMLNGQFWVREEGSSGLAANEQIRIIEQMTGKPYHMQTDVNDAVKEIKSGKGSGILSMSVDDSDYAFHAQYIPEVTSEIIRNPITGKKAIQDVIWTDNSWGNAEREYFWDGHNGFQYTDYGRGYGLKDGFMLASDNKIGLPASSIHGAVGVAKDDGNEEFGIFTDVILPGNPVDTYQKLYKMFNYVLNIKEGETYLTTLENALADGYKFSIKELEGLDDIAQAQLEKIMKRIERNFPTEDEFNKLPENDELKFAFKKLAVYLSTDNPMLADSVVSVTNDDELNEVKEDIFEEHINTMAAMLGKTNEAFDIIMAASYSAFEKLFNDIKSNFGKEFSDEMKKVLIGSIFAEDADETEYNGSITKLEDILVNRLVNAAVKNFDTNESAKYFIENGTNIIKKAIDEHIKIKSLDSSSITNSPLHTQLIAAIDKYLKPKSNEELLQLIQELQIADNEKATEFFDVLTPEDVGIKEKKPYDYLLRFRANSSNLYKALSDVVANQAIYEKMKDSPDGISATPEDLYRNLYVKLADMDVQKYIKSFKAEAFQKYKVRQAFPNPVVLPDESIKNTVQGMYKSIQMHADSINNTNDVIHILDLYKNICAKFIFNKEFMSIYKDMGDNEPVIQITKENAGIFSDFADSIIALDKLAQKDESFDDINKLTQNILNQFLSGNGMLNRKDFNNSIDSLVSIFEYLEKEGVTKERFVKLKKDELDALKYNVNLMVNANIDPKYRNEAFNKIDNLINLYRKGAKEEDIEYEQELLTDFIVKRHIIKNPTVLLKEAVKLLMDGKKDSDEYGVMREYLSTALSIAQQTKIQYKLVQNQHEALSAKTKEILPLFKVTMTNGQESPMDSENGFLYIINQLKNVGDNFATVNLFLEQAGLSASALNALINNFDIEKTNDLVDEKVKEIKQDLLDIDVLAETVDAYLSSNTIEYKDIKESINAIIKYVKHNLKDYKEIPVYKQFIKYLESLQFTGTFENSSQAIIKRLTGSITLDALQNIADSINGTMKYISEVNDYMQDEVQLVSSIRVPAGSDAYTRQVDFMHRYEAVQKHINDKAIEVVEAANQCKFLHSERTSA